MNEEAIWLNKALRRKKAKDRNLLLTKALSNKVKPITPEKLEALKIDSVLTLQTFKDNISSIFPYILYMTSQGESLPAIEKILGMNKTSLVQFLYRYPTLIKAIQAARDIRLDRIAL